MRYPNARLGIKILYHEAIASMIFALVSLIEIVCAIFDTAEIIDKIVHVLVILALILSLVDTILKVFGILKAALDEPIFYKAFYVIAFCALFEILGTFLDIIYKKEELLIYIMATLADISSAFVIVSVIGGISVIFRKANVVNPTANYKKMCICIIAVSALAILLDLFPLIIPTENQTLKIIFSAFGIISATIEVLIYLNFQLYLKRVEKIIEKIPKEEKVESV